MAKVIPHDGGKVAGKNVLVTGCTSGIGLQIVYQLADLKPNKIFLGCRNKAKGEEVQKELEAKGVKSAVLIGDMGSIAGCKQMADAMMSTSEELHILVSNAGLWEAKSELKVMSKEPGLEQHFMTNYMSMVVLCTELLPLLEQNTPSRIVITGSFTHMDIVKGVANLEDLQFEKSKITEKVNNDQTYAQSKLLQYMWAKKFATTVSKGVSVMVFDPGQCETNNQVYEVLKKMLKCCYCCFKKCMGTREAKNGAEIAVWCCDSTEAETANGKYVDFGIYSKLKYNAPCDLGYSPTHKKEAPSIKDEKQVEDLWEQTQQILKNHEAKK